MRDDARPVEPAAGESLSCVARAQDLAGQEKSHFNRSARRRGRKQRHAANRIKALRYLISVVKRESKAAGVGERRAEGHVARGTTRLAEAAHRLAHGQTVAHHACFYKMR